MNKVLIATKNNGKKLELAKLLADLSVELVSLEDVGIEDDVEETGTTYSENSQKKALFYAKKSGLPAISDDGGLEIHALGGEPGVRSRRWLGHEATDEELIAHMHKVSATLPEENRNASFRAVLSLALPNGQVWSVEGKVDGVIAKEPRMNAVKGFPYRVFFYLPDIAKYYQDEELSDEEQKLYNHRYKAVQKLRDIIKEKI